MKLRDSALTALVACVLISEDVVAVGVFHISSPASLSYLLPSLASHGHQIPTFGEPYFLGCAVEAPQPAIVATDSVSADTNWDNGGRGLPRRNLRGPDGA